MRDGPSWNKRKLGPRSVASSMAAPMPFAATFGQRHRQAAIAQIVRRFGKALVDDLANRRLHPLFVIHIERGRQSPQIVRGQLWRIAFRRSESRRGDPSRPAASPCGLLLERNGHRRGGLHQADDAHHRRRLDRLAQRFVIEADVAAGDRRFEEAAGFRDAFDRFHELRHDLRPLRIAEVQIVGGRHRQRADGRKIAAAFGDRQLARLRAARARSSGRCRRATSRCWCPVSLMRTMAASPPGPAMVLVRTV